jgi:two-component sensor histidine kinase
MQKAPTVPVVILSGQEDENLAIKAVHLGVQDYLIKSEITSKQLERALHYAIERQGLLRSLETTRKQQLEFKNQFLSHVSHELRTPLTCIHQYVTLLVDGLAGPVAPPQMDHLKTVLKSVNQLHAMIRDLLEATRADSGKLRVEQRCIDIGELLRQAVAMMRPSANEKLIRLEAVADQAIPLVYADPDRALEVFINLIDNAIKYTPANGSVLVKASLVETDPSSVYLSISDSGRGIPQEALPRYSNAFTRIRMRWMATAPGSASVSSSRRRSSPFMAAECGLRASPAKEAPFLLRCRCIRWQNSCFQSLPIRVNYGVSWRWCGWSLRRSPSRFGEAGKKPANRLSKSCGAASLSIKTWCFHRPGATARSRRFLCSPPST